MTQHLAGRRGRKGMRGEGAGSEIQSFDLVGGCGRVAAARERPSGTCATLLVSSPRPRVEDEAVDRRKLAAEW